ncbi:uncharacterized protein LOC136078392 [Hydra vulgaris]|uniref:Uncharacterized protein LOC136078392 n=1 Tax=Hydra vulgaris TaxID=6087 RepID=A0ABM4BME0_HYDVU
MSINTKTLFKADRIKVRTKRAGKRKKIFNRKVLRSSVSVNNVNFPSLSVNIELPVNSQTDIFDTPSSSLRKVEAVISSTSKNYTITKNKVLTGYIIIDCSILSDVISVMSCSTYFQTTLAIIENKSKKQGLACELSIICLKCKYQNDFYTSKLINKKGNFDISNRTVYTMRTLGIGHSGIKRFTTLMNMPKPMTPKNYDKLVLKITNITEKVAQETMTDAVSDIRLQCQDINEILDVGVSCDGTWQRRGFSSLNGVFAALSIDSGKVLDVEVMSRICRGCFLNQKLSKKDLTAYAEWRKSHISKMNFVGSAGGMECEGASRIFQQSIKKHKLQYINFLGDGDSKSYNSVKDVYPYIKVNKLECVGHYQKRVGTRLRKLKKKVRGLGGRGRLTDATIDQLQNFFGVAIRQNTGNLDAMKSAALATFFTDKANSTNTYKPGPGLPLEVVYKIRPVFEELTKEDELKKCLHGKTQNANESFHGKIWDRIPKTKYVR